MQKCIKTTQNSEKYSYLTFNESYMKEGMTLILKLENSEYKT